MHPCLHHRLPRGYFSAFTHIFPRARTLSAHGPSFSGRVYTSKLVRKLRVICGPSGDNISPSASPTLLPCAALCPRPGDNGIRNSLSRTSYPGGLGDVQSGGERKVNKGLRTSKTKEQRRGGKNTDRVVNRMNVGHRGKNLDEVQLRQDKPGDQHTKTFPIPL